MWGFIENNAIYIDTMSKGKKKSRFQLQVIDS